jgi:hypothetical protein
MGAMAGDVGNRHCAWATGGIAKRVTMIATLQVVLISGKLRRVVWQSKTAADKRYTRQTRFDS